MNTTNILLGLAQSIAILVTLAFIYSLLRPLLLPIPTRLRSLIQGLIFGLFGLLAILTGLPLSPGFSLDGRTVILSIAGFIGGPITGLIAALIVAAYRGLVVGGAGAPTGVVVCFTSAAVGMATYWYSQRKSIQPTARWFLLLGLLTVLVRVTVTLLMNGSQGLALLAETVVPSSILFSLATWLLGTLITNQEQQRANGAALAVERTMMRALIDNVPDYIFVKDREGRFLLSNLAQAQAAHVPAPADLLGRTAAAFFAPEYLTQPDLDDQAVLQGESIIAQERPSVDALGQPIWISTTKVPLRDADGQVTGIVGISRDITEHKQAEAALQQERNMLRTLIDNVPDYIFVKDSASRYLLSNLAHAHAAGATVPADLIGKTAAAFFPADYVLRHNDDDQVVLSGASIIAQERQTVNADGTRIWVSTTKVPLHDAQGEIMGMVGISRDITAHKQAEAALQQERNLLRTLIDNVPANVYIKDSQSRFVDANSETILKFGVKTASELIGKTDFDFFPPELAAKYYADDQAVIQSGQPMINIEEQTMEHPTQQQRWLLTTKAPVRNERGEVMGLVGVGLDITGRKQAEEALRANEAKLQTFFEVLPVGVSVLNSDGQIVEMNPALERILGMSMLGILTGAYQTQEYIDRDGRPMPRSELPSVRAVVEQKVIHDVEIGVLKEDETRVWTSVSAAPLPGSNAGVITVTADITERKRAQKALQESEERFRALVQHSTDVITILAADMTVLYESPSLEKVMGYRPDAVQGLNIADVIHPDDLPLIMEKMSTILDQPAATFAVEVRLRHADGSWRLQEATVTNLLDHPAIRGIVVNSRDITERKQTEAQLATQAKLLDQVSDSIIKLDIHGIIEFWNRGSERLYGWSAEEVTGKLLAEFIQTQVVNDTMENVVRRVLETGGWNGEYVQTRKDGTSLPVLNATTLLRDGHGNLVGYVGINRDITERKQADQQALELRNERQRAQVLHQFIGDATHDLMTPIAIINSSTDLARRALTPERLKAHLDKIERMSETLQSRLQDMLTMSQLDMMTAADLERREVDLAQLLQGLGGTFRASAEAKAQHLNVEIDPQAGTLQVDDLYLGMALGKIIENAIHYTDNGGTICISIARHEAQVAIAVRDTGIGISEADLVHIFERFYRAQSHRPLEAGAGLGLSIAQRIIDLHRGRIDVTSVLGSGSTFTLLLPNNL